MRKRANKVVERRYTKYKYGATEQYQDVQKRVRKMIRKETEQTYGITIEKVIEENTNLKRLRMNQGKHQVKTDKIKGIAYHNRLCYLLTNNRKTINKTKERYSTLALNKKKQDTRK